MANFYLRPGSWKLVHTGSSTKEIRIDNDIFQIPPGNSTAQTIEVSANISISGDDSDLVFYRNPVAPLSVTSNLGETEQTSSGSTTTSTTGGGIKRPKKKVIYQTR